MRLLAEEVVHHNPLPIHPNVIGAIVLGVLFALMIGLLMFGKGRDHS